MTSNDDERELVFRALSAYDECVDEKAITQIISACRTRVRNCPARDIVAAIHAKGPGVCLSSTARSVLAILISIVPSAITAVQQRRIMAEEWRESEQHEQQTRELIERHLRNQPDENPWTSTKRLLGERVSKHSFGIWFLPTHYAGSENSVVLVRVPTAEHKNGVANYEAEIRKAQEDLGLGSAEIRFISDEELAEKLVTVRFAPESPSAEK